MPFCSLSSTPNEKLLGRLVKEKVCSTVFRLFNASVKIGILLDWTLTVENCVSRLEKVTCVGLKY